MNKFNSKFSTEEKFEKYFEENIKPFLMEGKITFIWDIYSLWFTNWIIAGKRYKEKRNEILRNYNIIKKPKRWKFFLKEDFDKYFYEHIKKYCFNNTMISYRELEKLKFSRWAKSLVYHYNSFIDFAHSHNLIPYRNRPSIIVEFWWKRKK